MQTSQSIQPLLIRVEEAAHLLSLSRSTVYELLASGDLPSVTIGAARRIPMAALEEWVLQRTEGAHDQT
jgi:excisionase family DNA binding protein